MGIPFVQGPNLVGMLTQIPQGTIVKTPAGISNLSRALQMMRKARGFHHVKLLRAGQQVLTRRRSAVGFEKRRDLGVAEPPEGTPRPAAVEHGDLELTGRDRARLGVGCGQ